MTIVQKQKFLESLQEEYRNQSHPFADFKKTKIVFGVGDLNAKLLFLGEGPGADEDKMGEPFVGRAGQLLTKIINAMGLSRDQVYITNVIKCRLENNRAPFPEEIDYEKKVMLDAELAILSPKIICTLGSSATCALLGYQQTISKMRGNFFEYKNSLVIPTYHPAYLLRNPSAKTVVWTDMQKILAELSKEETSTSITHNY